MSSAEVLPANGPQVLNSFFSFAISLMLFQKTTLNMKLLPMYTHFDISTYKHQFDSLNHK